MVYFSTLTSLRFRHFLHPSSQLIIITAGLLQGSIWHYGVEEGLLMGYWEITTLVTGFFFLF